MIKSTFNNIEIAAVATAVSTKWTPVEKFIGDTDEKSIAKFKKNTGVEGRYDAGNKQTTSDFCFAAAKKTIEHTNTKLKDIGLLIFVTQTPDYRIPATACVLHKRLGLSSDCMAFDINQGCAGMVYGINVACGVLNSSNADVALLLFGDTIGKRHRRNIGEGLTDEDDNESKLFGDAGAAILLKKKQGASQIDCAMRTDGEGFKSIIVPYGGYKHLYGPDIPEMDGVEVFNFAIEKPPILIKELMEDIGTTAEDYDCLILHQANKFIMKQVARRSGFSNKQNLISIDKFGNTSSASIATALTKYYGEDNEGVVKVMMCGFGIGLSWGAVSAEIKKENILPLIQTDEYFDDGYKDVQPEKFV